MKSIAEDTLGLMGGNVLLTFGIHYARKAKIQEGKSLLATLVKILSG